MPIGWRWDQTPPGSYFARRQVLNDLLGNLLSDLVLSRRGRSPLLKGLDRPCG